MCSVFIANCDKVISNLQNSKTKNYCLWMAEKPSASTSALEVSWAKEHLTDFEKGLPLPGIIIKLNQRFLSNILADF